MTSREWHALPRDVRDTLLSHQEQAPIKLGQVARALGLPIKSATLPAGVSGEIRPDPERAGAFLIRVNRHDNPKRQRFTVAHEIAHFLLHRDQIGKGIRDDVLYRSSLSDRREAEANRLAADLLMPQHLIEDALKAARTLRVEDVASYLAERFDVSEAAMKIKLGLK